MTSAEYCGKKTQLVLFINGRAVDCSPLKRTLEATYAALLPKTTKPFAFLVIIVVITQRLLCCFVSGDYNLVNVLLYS